MALWSKKKIAARLSDFFDSKEISYTLEDGTKEIYRFELCLMEIGYLVFPYLTVDIEAALVSFNVNLASYSCKNYNYLKLNDFNLKSKFFKAYIASNGTVSLEYRFCLMENFSLILETLINELMALQVEIDKL